MQNKHPEDSIPQQNPLQEYTISNEKLGITILSIGMSHSTKPGNPQFSTERQTQIKEFLGGTDPTVSMTVVEFDEVLAERKWVEASPLEDVIRRFGESGFTAKLSWEAGVEVCCLESSVKEQVQHVLEKYQAQDVLLRFIVLFGLNYTSRRNSQDEAFENYMSRRFDELKDCADLKESIELDSLVELWGRETNLPFTFEGLTRFRIELFEKYAGAEFVQIDRAVLQYRDSVIIQGIETKLNSGIKKMLLIQGEGHTVRQKPILEEIITTLT